MRDAPDPGHGNQPAASGGSQASFGNQAVARFAAAFNADFSDVRFHAQSAAAAAIGARAFTEGTDVHFAPGELRPGDRAGDELIAHELAHVIQQRRQRAVATTPAAEGPALEAEADAQAARAVTGAPARPGAALSRPTAIAAPVLQGKFTVSSKITSEDEDEVRAADLFVDYVQITNKRRPETRLQGSQGRHTLAWEAKTRYWQALLSQVSYERAFARLEALAEDDARVDTTMGSKAADEMREQLLAVLRGAEDASLPSSTWIEKLTWAITTYAKTYQLAAATAFPSGNPKGKNEAGHLKTMTEAQASLKAGGTPDARTVLAAARGLVDLHANLPPIVLHKVFSDWIKLIKTTWPLVFDRCLNEPPADYIDRLKTVGYPAVKDIQKRMQGSDDLLDTDDLDVEEQEKAGTAEEQAASDVLADAGGDEQLRETEPFLVRVGTALLAGTEQQYPPDQLTVERLIVSDERPDTQFGTAQKSHTIPWSLDRIAWIRQFSGTTLDVVIQRIREHAETDAGWSAEQTQDHVKRRRAAMINVLQSAPTEEWDVPTWTSWLDVMVEAYVETYSASPFATFGTEASVEGDSAARGRGEAAALAKLKGWEADLTAGRAGPKEDEVVTWAQKLIEVPQLTQNRQKVDIVKLEERWLKDMAAVFPKLCARYGPAMRAAYAKAEVQSQRMMDMSEIYDTPHPTTRSKHKAAAAEKEGKKARF